MSNSDAWAGIPVLTRDRSQPDIAALERLFRDSYPAVVRTALRVVGNQPEAEEIAADAFLKLAREWPAVRNPVSWLKRCAIRGALDALRSAGRRKRREANSPPVSGTETSPEAMLDLNGRRWRVRHILSGLKARDAEMLVARADGASYQEIADTLNLNPNSVGKLLARAEDNFRKRYEERYGTD